MRVDLAQQIDLHGEGRAGHPVGVGVQAPVRAHGRIGHRPAAVPHGEARRLGRAPQRRLGDLGRVRVAGRLAPHRAQAEALRRVVARLAHAPVVVAHHLRAPPLEEQLPVVGAGHRLAQDRERAGLVEMGVEWAEVGMLGHGASLAGGLVRARPGSS